MAVDKVTICSNALLRLGGNTIASFDEDSDGALLASNLYDTTRDKILRSHPWNCAVKRVILAPDTEVPEFDWTAQFSLPSDWLKTISVGQLGEEIEFKSEARKLLADTSALYLRYIYRNEVEATWDALLIDAVTLAMAAEMAYPITESTSLMQVLKQELRETLKQARAVDGQDDPPDEFGDYPLLQARYTGSTRY